MTTRTKLDGLILAASMLTVVLWLVPAAHGSFEQRREASIASATAVRNQTVTLVVAAPSRDHDRLVRWAAGRFQEAGLALPPLAVSFHLDRERCDGHGAAFWTGTGRITVCGLDDPSSVAARKIVLHEMAHGWLETSIDDATRREFLFFRGLTTWDDPDRPWTDRGFEQAADIMAWGLMDVGLWMASLPESDEATLARAYRILTGHPPPFRVGGIE